MAQSNSFSSGRSVAEVADPTDPLCVALASICMTALSVALIIHLFGASPHERGQPISDQTQYGQFGQ